MDMPSGIQAGLEPGSRAYMMGNCSVIVSLSGAGYHMSIARPDRYPSWDEVSKARYALIPDNVTMAMMLPPQSEFINIHSNCFQLWQVQHTHSMTRPAEIACELCHP